jgi:ribosomal protein S24E
MQMELIDEKSNPVFKRNELTFRLDYGAGRTPSKADMQAAVAHKKKVALEQVEVVNISSDVGVASGRAIISIWEEKKMPIYGKKEAPATPENEEKKVE